MNGVAKRLPPHRIGIFQTPQFMSVVDLRTLFAFLSVAYEKTPFGGTCP
jgi:hypothetical protein